MRQTLRLNGASTVEIAQAATILREGGTVAFPTETVYGRGANALDPAAVAKIFEAKQRPAWDPLIVHVSSASQLATLTRMELELVERVEMLARAFWPGPLTLLLPRSAAVPDAVTAGRHLVGIRMPAHPIARALLEAVGIPIAAPSANTFGHTSPTTAAHVLADLDGRIDAVVDGGAAAIGVESTVLNAGANPMVLYRPGAVTAEMITHVTGLPVKLYEPGARVEAEHPESLPSPGVGIRHYAPRAKVVLTQGSETALCRAAELDKQAGSIVGVLLPEGWRCDAAHIAEAWGNWHDPQTLAAGLFGALRALDDRGAATILCPLPTPGGLNDAIRDRLTKAAKTE